MLNFFTLQDAPDSISITPFTANEFTAWCIKQSPKTQNLVAAYKFKAKPNTFCLLHNEEGNLETVLLGIESQEELLAFGMLPSVLPEGVYKINPLTTWQPENFHAAAIAWGLGVYSFSQYKTHEAITSKLFIPNICDWQKIDLIVSSIFLARDLINTPAADMRPVDVATIAEKIAKQHQAQYKCISGDALITANFPAIYAVGKGGENAPLLVELHWHRADKNAPKVTLIGKGVCFDSGGLDIKNPSGMLLMKKDMAGAAHALALAQMLMASHLPINLRVILPLVENLVDAKSYKPGDIIKMRNGKTVEVRNTDAEGRLILADALAYAMEGTPDLLIDFATLTGAARVALGAKIAALFTPNDELAAAIDKFTQTANEAVWRLPLYKPYKQLLKGKITDLLNISNSEVNGAGAITAALFLQEFVGTYNNWLHFDMTAYNFSSSPSKPEGGEAMCLQGIFNYLQHTYG